MEPGNQMDTSEKASHECLTQRSNEINTYQPSKVMAHPTFSQTRNNRWTIISVCFFHFHKFKKLEYFPNEFWEFFMYFNNLSCSWTSLAHIIENWLSLISVTVISSWGQSLWYYSFSLLHKDYHSHCSSTQPRKLREIIKILSLLYCLYSSMGESVSYHIL